MPNMSYCRFRNTRTDLLECQNHWNDVLLRQEESEKEALINLMIEILTDEGYEVSQGTCNGNFIDE